MVPTCSGKPLPRDAVTGKWGECPKVEDKAVAAVCGDGLNPGTSRDKTPGVCKDAGNKDEVAKCADDSKQSKNADTGEWECPKDKPAKACGDGY